MMQLSDNQTTILRHAITETEGRIEWFPDNIHGGARIKVLEALHRRAMVIPGQPHWSVTAEGYDAVGVPRPGMEPATVHTAEPTTTPTAERKTFRAGSKQAQVIEAMSSTQGVTIEQMMTLTGWKQHSVRGMLANLKKAGWTVNSEKTDGERYYRTA